MQGLQKKRMTRLSHWASSDSCLTYLQRFEVEAQFIIRFGVMLKLGVDKFKWV